MIIVTVDSVILGSTSKNQVKDFYIASWTDVDVMVGSSGHWKTALASPLTLNSKTDIWPVCNANFVPLQEMMND